MGVLRIVDENLDGIGGAEDGMIEHTCAYTVDDDCGSETGGSGVDTKRRRCTRNRLSPSDKETIAKDIPIPQIKTEQLATMTRSDQEDLHKVTRLLHTSTKIPIHGTRKNPRYCDIALYHPAVTALMLNRCSASSVELAEKTLAVLV